MLVFALDFDGDNLLSFVGEVGVEVHLIPQEVDADGRPAEVNDGEVVGGLDAAGLFEVTDGEALGEVLFVLGGAASTGLFLLDYEGFVLFYAGDGVEDFLEAVLVLSRELSKLFDRGDGFADSLIGNIYSQDLSGYLEGLEPWGLGVRGLELHRLDDRLEDLDSIVEVEQG